MTQKTKTKQHEVVCFQFLSFVLWSALIILFPSLSLAGTPLIPSAYKAAVLRQVTLYKCTDQSIFSFSPDGGKVVYDLDGKIWLMWQDGSHKQPLTDGFHPSFSSDGKNVAYQDEESVLSFELETQTKKHVSAHGRMPLFSPTSPKLAYLTTEDLSNNLYLYEEDNAQSRPLTEIEQDRKIVDFSWSPDGEWLVYTTQQFFPGKDEVNPSTSDIRVLNLSGSFHEKVIAAGEGGFAALSPQGRFLSYAAQKEKTVCLWRVSLEDGASKLLECGDAPDDAVAQTLSMMKPSFSLHGDLLFPFYHAQDAQFSVSWFNADGVKVMDVAKVAGLVREIRWQSMEENFGFFVSKSMKPSSSFALYMGDFFPAYFNEEKLPLPLPLLQSDENFLLPLKPLAQKVGADVDFHSQDKRIEIYHEISYSVLTLLKRDAQVNGEKVVLQTAPQIIGGLLYVPLDFLIKAFAIEASFDETGQKLYLSYKEKEKKKP